MHHFRSVLILSLVPLSALAGSSADYSLDPAVVDFGGLMASSVDYAVNASAMVGGIQGAEDYALRSGYAGQLMDPVAMTLDGAGSTITLNERGSRQLAATLRYDDDTTGALSADHISWSVVSGPISGISSGGLMTAGSVYQNTSAEVHAVYQSMDGTLQISVVNTGNDDFGNYAADGLPDTWQVQYFGESGSQGVATADGDSDGLNNLQEYAFGMNPSQGSASAVAWNGSTLQSAGTPIAFASGTGSSFTFRAVFARRLDYLTAHLTYAVEFSADLVTWKASTSTPTVLAADGQVQAVSVPYPFSVNGKKAKFFRVKVQSQP
jgi:hypothetical protein